MKISVTFHPDLPAVLERSGTQGQTTRIETANLSASVGAEDTVFDGKKLRSGGPTTPTRPSQ